MANELWSKVVESRHKVYTVYKLFTIAQLLDLVIFEAVSLMRENLRGFKENFKVQNLTHSKGSVGRMHFTIIR